MIYLLAILITMLDRRLQETLIVQNLSRKHYVLNSIDGTQLTVQQLK